jgi:hypothetical protein
MGRHIPNDGYDAYFAFFEACTRQDLVSDEETPTDLTNTLATATLDEYDFSIGAGDPDGRRLTIAEKDSILVTANGTTRHAVLAYLVSEGPDVWEIRLVTLCSERVVSFDNGDRVKMSTYYLEVGAPVAPE